MSPASLFGVLGLLAAETAPSEDLEAMLRRLAEHSARVQALSKSGVTMSTSAEQLDGSGKVESRTESVERRFEKDGVETTELRRFVRDGQDALAQERARREKRNTKPKGDSQERSFRVSSPFSSDAVALHRFTLLGPDPEDPALRRVKFEPKGAASPDLLVGEAAVDPVAGTVRWIRCRPSKNPRHVTRMEMEMVYGVEAPGGPALSRVKIAGEGGLLFIKKGYRSESTFSDYGGGASR
jgi:hypothetical protein